jgi:hypothetical protein
MGKEEVSSACTGFLAVCTAFTAGLGVTGIAVPIEGMIVTAEIGSGLVAIEAFSRSLFAA